MNITGAILKKLRNNKNMTLEALVTDVNKKFNIKVSARTISRWERGKSEAKYDTLKCLALYYNVTTDFLLGFDLDKYADIIDLSNDLEIVEMEKELKEKCAMLMNKYA